MHLVPLLQIPLHRRWAANVRIIGVLAEFPQGPTLPQEVPALVQADFERLEAALRCGVVCPARDLLPQLLLLPDQLFDVAENPPVVHRSVPPRLAWHLGLSSPILDDLMEQSVLDPNTTRPIVVVKAEIADAKAIHDTINL